MNPELSRFSSFSVGRERDMITNTCLTVLGLRYSRLRFAADACRLDGLADQTLLIQSGQVRITSDHVRRIHKHQPSRKPMRVPCSNKSPCSLRRGGMLTQDIPRKELVCERNPMECV